MSDWKLLIEDDVGDTTSVPLLRGVITIGRKEGNTVRLTARNVSRFHARLVTKDEQLFIEDLDSYNGVNLNGDRIKGRVAVNEGDLIEIGDYHLALQLEVVQTAAGGMASAVSDLFPDNTDDAFAGETQRWEPSPSQLPTRDSFTTPLGLEGLDTDETARMPTAQGSAEMRTAEESEGDVSDPLSPGLSSLRSLAALDADNFNTPMVGSPLLNFGEAEVETEQLPVVENGHPQIPPTTEPYFQAYVEPTDQPEPVLPPVDLNATVVPARVSLVDAPTPDIEDLADLSSSSPSIPEFGEPPAAQVSAPIAPSASGDADNSPLPLSVAPSLASAAAAPLPTEAFLTPAEREHTAPVKSQLEAPSVTQPSALPSADASVSPNIETEATEAMPLAPGGEVDNSLPRLVALNTVLAGASFPIEGEDMVVGRVEGCDLLIQHKSVSRSHCRLVREGDVVRVIDLKSANGTLVNSVELDQAILHSGDVLELGTVLLRFVPVGDDFSLTTQEIVRAREAEANASEWQDDSTLTSLSNSQGAKGGAPSFGKIAAALGLLFVVAMLAFVMGRTSNQSEGQSEPSATRATESNDEPNETSE